MSNLKLRMKVGVHEFDAEGPAEEVNSRFDIWRELIGLRQPTAMPQVGEVALRGYAPNVTIAETPLPLATERTAMLQRVFALDDKRGIVTLRVHPTGDTAEADAILALIYGYWALRNEDEVRVTNLTKSVRMSGMPSERIDRMAGPHLGSALTKIGQGKGGKYLLTAPGRAKAESVVREMYERVA
jgi:hypothetical protein